MIPFEVFRFHDAGAEGWVGAWAAYPWQCDPLFVWCHGEAWTPRGRLGLGYQRKILAHRAVPAPLDVVPPYASPVIAQIALEMREIRWGDARAAIYCTAGDAFDGDDKTPPGRVASAIDLFGLATRLLNLVLELP